MALGLLVMAGRIPPLGRARTGRTGYRSCGGRVCIHLP